MADREVRMATAEDIESKGLKKLLVDNMPFFVKLTGLLVKSVGKVPVGDSLMTMMGKMSASIIVNQGVFNVSKANDPVDVTSEWLKMLKGIEASLEIGKVTENEVEVNLLECPLGLTSKDGRKTCITAMATDSATVKNLGGKLIIGETIATGADKCYLKVVRAD